MYLIELTLNHFKNFEKNKLTFSSGLNCITGLNGMGKTNILDAIHCLCVVKSHFNLSDLQIIRTGEQFARLAGKFKIKDQFDQIVIKVPINAKKIVERNGTAYKRFADHLGLLPVVMIAPDSTEIITGSSEERRRFLDTTLCQVDHNYTINLTKYNKVLKQRNAYLKLNKAQPIDLILLDAYDKQLIEPALYIHKIRKDYIEQLQPLIIENYAQISGGREEVRIEYNSQLSNNNMVELLESNRYKDQVSLRTNAGIHKDDITIYMNDLDARKFSSQGQIKSILFAAKFAEYNYLSKQIDSLPILLLDDIFDKLDSQRVNRLLEILSRPVFGQTFITDTTTERLLPMVAEMYEEYNSFKIENGKIIKHHEKA